MQNIHQEFIRRLIKDPIDSYLMLAKEFKTKHDMSGQFEELWPMVQDLLTEINSERILNICKKDPAITLMKKLVLQDLRHVSLPGVAFMPYGETLRTIERALEFFDICIRYEKFKEGNVNIETFVLEEEDPRARQFAYYHRYRYLYYYHWLLDKMPEALLIPTTAELSVDDMMRLRCVPIFFLGISTKLIYVDEFEQTPVEFFMHDINHSRRQFLANLNYFKTHNIQTVEQKRNFYKESYEFSKQLLDSLTVTPEDDEHIRSMKNLKRIILFEITHEDADVFMSDAIAKSLQRKEGFISTFEVPVLDPSTGLMNVSYTKEIGISTLAYTRYKLQHSFYGKNADNKKYRTTQMIAQAAYELLVEIEAKPEPGVPTDEKGNITYEYLLERACSYGPEIVHESKVEDPDFEKLNSGTKEVNKKSYFKENEGEAEKVETIISQATTHEKPLAEIRIVTDIALYFHNQNDGTIHVYLPKRDWPPFAEMPCLPGGYVWEGETSRRCAERVMQMKIKGLDGSKLEYSHTVDDINRDPRGHLISFVFKREATPEEITLLGEENFYSIKNLPDTGFDHAQIVKDVFSKK